MRRALAIGAALVVAVLAGVGGASAFIGSTGQDTVDAVQAAQPDGSGASLRASAPDPSRDHPWAVRVYRSVTGLTCPEVGRTQDGDFGQVDADGKFQPNTIQAAGSCIDLDQAPMSLSVNHYPANDDRGARAVVFGVVSGRVRGATLALSGQAAAPLAITNGAFIAVVSEADLVGATVVATLADGSTKPYALGPNTMPATEAPVATQ